MISGPLAIIILAVAAVRFTSGQFALVPIAVFAGTGFVLWLILHPLLGAMLRRVAVSRLDEDIRVRLQLMDNSIDAGFDHPELQQELRNDALEDPGFSAVWLALFVVKWGLIVAVSWSVAL